MSGFRRPAAQTATYNTQTSAHLNRQSGRGRSGYGQPRYNSMSRNFTTTANHDLSTAAPGLSNPRHAGAGKGNSFREYLPHPTRLTCMAVPITWGTLTITCSSTNSGGLLPCILLSTDLPGDVREGTLTAGPKATDWLQLPHTQKLCAMPLPD